jgi:hypothetical protein
MRIVISLVLIAVVVGVPAFLLARRRRRGAGTSSPTEFLVYLILVVATLIATNAVSSLIELVLPGDGVLIREPDQLALSLATLLVAGIVAVATWMTLERQSAVGERPARALYVSAVTGFSMAVVAASIVELGLWAVGRIDFSAVALADLLTFGACWWLHEQARHRGVPLDDVRALVGSLVGLSLSAGGFGLILEESLTAVFDSGSILTGRITIWEGVVAGLVPLAVGAVYLWWFWLRDLSGKAIALRNGYAALVSISVWFTGLVALAALVYAVLAWAFGLDGFDDLTSPYPIQIATAVTAGLIYWHHRGILGRLRSPLVRLVEYLFSAAGFVIGAGALTTLGAVLIENLAGGAVAGGSRQAVLAASIALVTSLLVLWRYWLPAQRLAHDPAEQKALSRRVFVIGLLTLAAVVGAGGLIAILYVVLRSALGGEAPLADTLAWSIPLTIVAGGLAWYFARVRPPKPGAAAAEAEGALKVSVVTVIASDPGPLPEMIDGMRFLRRADDLGVVDQALAERVVAALAGLESRAAVVTVGPSGFEVIPVR